MTCIYDSMYGRLSRGEQALLVIRDWREGRLKTLTCFDGELVRVDPDVWEWADGYRWKWSRYGAFRNEPAPVHDRKVWLHREIMGEPEGIKVGFLDKDPSNCCRGNLFLFREGWNKLARARARGGVCGQGTHNPPFGEKYETLGCVCGALTRVEIDNRTKRCCKCRRRLSDDSL